MRPLRLLMVTLFLFGLTCLGCKGKSSAPTAPSSPSGTPSVVFDSWWQITVQGNVGLAHGYAKNIGNATAYNVDLSYAGSGVSTSPTTLVTGAKGSFVVYASFQGGDPALPQSYAYPGWTPTFVWTTAS